jgi:hypothetical protein
MLFKTQQFELADRASILSVICDEIVPIQVGCWFFSRMAVVTILIRIETKNCLLISEIQNTAREE